LILLPGNGQHKLCHLFKRNDLWHKTLTVYNYQDPTIQKLNHIELQIMHACKNLVATFSNRIQSDNQTFPEKPEPRGRDQPHADHHWLRRIVNNSRLPILSIICHAKLYTEKPTKTDAGISNYFLQNEQLCF
jgi:hypothetical protein